MAYQPNSGVRICLGIRHLLNLKPPINLHTAQCKLGVQMLKGQSIHTFVSWVRNLVGFIPNDVTISQEGGIPFLFGLSFFNFFPQFFSHFFSFFNFLWILFLILFYSIAIKLKISSNYFYWMELSNIIRTGNVAKMYQTAEILNLQDWRSTLIGMSMRDDTFISLHFLESKIWIRFCQLNFYQKFTNFFGSDLTPWQAHWVL